MVSVLVPPFPQPKRGRYDLLANIYGLGINKCQRVWNRILQKICIR